MADSARKIDQNGYVTIPNNPISRSGIFKYLGKQISKDAEPDKIYNVYRPDEELSNPEALASFNLVPWTDDHVMLGPEGKGLVDPADETKGTTGQDVYFKDGVLYATIKIYSQRMRNVLQQGKSALSLGYRCSFIKQSGVFNGEPYEYIQRNLRGNHLALVDSPRCDVAVLDHQQYVEDHFDLALDQEELKTMADEDRMKKIEDGLTKALDWMKTKDESEAKEKKEAEDKKVKDAKDAADKKAKDEATTKPGSGGTMAGCDEDKEKEKKMAEDKKAKDEAEEKEKKDKEEKEGMDSAIKTLTGTVEALQKDGFKTIMKTVVERDTLAKSLEPFIGVFDHSEMTPSEVAKYGVEKLKLQCTAGQEMPVLNGYLAGRQSNDIGFGMDASFVGKKGKYAEAKAKRAE